MYSINRSFKRTNKMLLDLGVHAQNTSIKTYQYFAQFEEVCCILELLLQRENKLWKFNPRCSETVAHNVPEAF